MKKKLLVTLFAVLILIGAALSSVLSVSAEDTVYYWGKKDGEWQELPCVDYTLLTSDYLAANDYTLNGVQGGSVFVLKSDVEISEPLKTNGDVILVFFRDPSYKEYTLTCNKGIVINGNLTVTNRFGNYHDKSNLFAFGYGLFAGIGGTGTFTVNGGGVEATGGGGAAAIGGDDNSRSGLDLIVNFGQVKATVEEGGGAAIGGGRAHDGGNVTVNGGILYADVEGNGAAIGAGSGGEGGTLIVNDGTVHADAEDGAGIGGGTGGDGGTVIINGGTVYAKSVNGAGIGGGYSQGAWGIGAGGDGGTVEVHGGEVTAISGSSAAIGGATRDGNGGTFKIWNGTVRATSNGGGAAIGGSYEGDGGTVVVYGGTVIANANGKYGDDGGGAAIGGGEDADGGSFVIYGGYVEAITKNWGAGIGGGSDGDAGTFEMYGGRVKAESEHAWAVGKGSGGSEPLSSDFIIGNTIILYNERKHRIENSVQEAPEVNLFNTGSIDLSARTPAEYPVEYEYLDEAGHTRSGVCSDYKIITKDTATLTGGWYVLNGTGHLFHGLKVTGDSHLIILNAADVYVTGGIMVDRNVKFSIYSEIPGRDAETFEPGSVIAYGSDTMMFPYRGTGILIKDDGELTLYGGEIYAYGDKYGPGVNGNVSLCGGSLYAEGANGAAGIGSGRMDSVYDYYYYPGTVKLFRGTLTAIGSEASSPIEGPEDPYFDLDKQTRAIGGGYKCNENGSIVLGDGCKILDKYTGNAVLNPNSLDWTEVITDSSVSLEIVRPVSYLAYNETTGETETRTVDRYQSANVLTRYADQWRPIPAGWYVLEDDLSWSMGITGSIGHCQGDVHLILSDNCTMTYDVNTLDFPNGGALHVYAQSSGSAMGKWDGSFQIMTDLVLHGGSVTTTKVIGDLTLYGGELRSSGTVTGNVFGYGGTLVASGAGNAAIGGDLTLFSGSVTANTNGNTAIVGDLALHGGRLSLSAKKGTSAIGGNVTVDEAISVLNADTLELLVVEDGDWRTELNNAVPITIDTTDLMYLEFDPTEMKYNQRLLSGLLYSELDGGNDVVLASGNFFVKNDVTLNTVTVNGDVSLFLKDGCTMRVTQSIIVSEGNSLTVYAQSTGSNMGTLNVSAKKYYAAIGAGGDLMNCGRITIHGGNIIADGTNGEAGIGGTGAKITIHGGNVTATGNIGGAGIGSSVSAVGNPGVDITINGGKITAVGGSDPDGLPFGGAGIGSGVLYLVEYDPYEGLTGYGHTGRITVNGGEITAVGGIYAAGIGGGAGCDGGTVLITDGHVSAVGGPLSALGSKAGGIGCGWFDYEDFIFMETETLPVENETSSVTVLHAVVSSNNVPVAASHENCLTLIEAKAATCYSDGISTSHYLCSGENGCGKVFSDAEGKIELSEHNFVIPQTGHDYTGDYLDNGDGTHSRECVFGCGETLAPELHTDLDHDGVCDLCEAGIVPDASPFIFTAKSLLLDSDLGFRFKGYSSEDLPETAYVVFTIGNIRTVTVPIDEAEEDIFGRIVFTCRMNVLEAGEEISAVLHTGGENDEIVESNTPTSVADYLDIVAAMHADRTEAIDKATVALAEMTATYLHHAQIALDETHPGYTVGGESDTYLLVEARAELAETTAESLASFKAKRTTQNDFTGIVKTSRSLLLDDRTSIVLYLTPADGYEPESITVTDQDGEAVSFSKTKQKDGRIRIVIPGLEPTRFDESFTVSVDGGKMTVSNLSVFSYCYSVLAGNSTAANKNAVSALCEYYRAAVLYQLSAN